MDATRRVSNARRTEAGFTLVEALVAIVVLVFGLMAVTNLLIVAASSNTVANQGTAAVTSATRVMDWLKNTSFRDDADLTTPTRPFLTPGGLAWPVAADPACAAALACGVAPVTDYHCNDTVPGVGGVHTHWWITLTAAEPRLLYLRVRSEGTGALSAARSRAEFTGFSTCTAAPRDATTPGNCPGRMDAPGLP
jgi:type II secretory pathway pseudopilin PulG